MAQHHHEKERKGASGMFRRRRGLLLIILAALLLEGISGIQYLVTRHYMEEELEKRAENELTLKAILIKSNLNDAEDLLRNCLWNVEHNLDQPDSALTIISRLVQLNPKLKGAGVAFVPNYYPEKGRLYEAYANRTPSGKVETRQIGSDTHDYTQYDFYQQVLQADKGFWVDPYYDHEGAHSLITSFFQPVSDLQGQTVGFVGVDIDVRWLSDTIGNQHIYPSSFILVMTESNKLVIHPDISRIGANTQNYIRSLICDSTMARHQSRSGRSTVMYFDDNGREGCVFYANMRVKPHWLMVVVCYDDEVYAPLMSLRLLLLGLMAIAFAILLYVVWRFVRGVQTMEITSRQLEEKTQEQERMDTELRIANRIQQALLPLAEPSLQGVGEIEVEGRLIPAKAVGGDLYNAFVRNGKLFFCVGDVSGKGVPAALIMAVTQTLFHHIASREDNPARIMEYINETASSKNPQNIFVTLFIGVLDLPTGHLRYCNAGHEIPFLLANGKESQVDCVPNIPIGLFSDFNYQQQRTTMQPGSTLFLYTDGLTEARNVSRDFFGRKRLDELMARCAGMGSKEMVDTVVTELTSFVGAMEQSDDLTLLAIRYTPAEGKLILDERLSLHNNIKEVSQLSTFIKEVMTRLGIGKPLAPKLRLALEEAVVNVMEYAYPKGIQGDVDIRATYDGECLRLIISDSGIAFNPTETAKADTTLSAEERPVGGLGILLMSELMDFINYERTDGHNILTMTKRIERKT